MLNGAARPRRDYSDVLPADRGSEIGGRQIGSCFRFESRRSQPLPSRCAEHAHEDATARQKTTVDGLGEVGRSDRQPRPERPPAVESGARGRTRGPLAADQSTAAQRVFQAGRDDDARPSRLRVRYERAGRSFYSAAAAGRQDDARSDRRGAAAGERVEAIRFEPLASVRLSTPQRDRGRFDVRHRLVVHVSPWASSPVGTLNREIQRRSRPDRRMTPANAA